MMNEAVIEGFEEPHHKNLSFLVDLEMHTPRTVHELYRAGMRTSGERCPKAGFRRRAPMITLLHQNLRRCGSAQRLSTFYTTQPNGEGIVK